MIRPESGRQLISWGEFSTSAGQVWKPHHSVIIHPAIGNPRTFHRQKKWAAFDGGIVAIHGGFSIAVFHCQSGKLCQI